MVEEPSGVLNVPPASMCIAEAPATLQTSVGSSVAICVYQPAKKIGGIINYVFPKPYLDAHSQPRLAKYGVSAIPLFFEDLKQKWQVEPNECFAKVFGGAQVFKVCSEPVGEQNRALAEALLQDLAVPLECIVSGQEQGCRLEFNLENGEVLFRQFGQEVKTY